MFDGKIMAEHTVMMKRIIDAAQKRGAGIPDNKKRPLPGPSYKNLKAANELLRSENLRLATERDLLLNIVRYSAGK